MAKTKDEEIQELRNENVRLLSMAFMAKTKDEEIQELRNENVRLLSMIDDIQKENESWRSECKVQARKAVEWKRKYHNICAHISALYDESFAERENS